MQDELVDESYMDSGSDSDYELSMEEAEITETRLV